MDPTELTQSLISIPSYVSSNCDESQLGKYLEKLMIKSFPEFKTKRQYIDSDKKRFNLICLGSASPLLLVIGHIDTVQPEPGWQTDPLKPVKRNGRIIGLGSSDMKGSIAAFLSALDSVKDKIDLANLAILFYVDEEYQFKGIKEFIKKNSKSDSRRVELSVPELVISLDGELEISSGCRGYIEVEATFQSHGGHSANPSLGINVISAVSTLAEILARDFGRFYDDYLGSTTFNLAYFQGGNVARTGNRIEWSKTANLIPNYAEVLIEVRPSVDKIDGPYVIKRIEKVAKTLRLDLVKAELVNDLRILPVAYNSPEIKRIEKTYRAAKIPMTMQDKKFCGYNDMQMLRSLFDVPMFKVGAGSGPCHVAGESVSIEDLRKSAKLWAELLLGYCSK